MRSVDQPAQPRYTMMLLKSLSALTALSAVNAHFTMQYIWNNGVSDIFDL
jgi:hypothetical protein